MSAVASKRRYSANSNRKPKKPKPSTSSGKCENGGKDFSGARPAAVIQLDDVTCPICVCVLVEPVTMPCDHEICLPCFQQHLQENKRNCPFCRMYISNWARRSSRLGTLVNQSRWKTIQRYFPQEVQERLDGVDSNDIKSDDGVPSPAQTPKLSKPGEIGQEYELQMQKVQVEIEEERERENKKSDWLIRMLIEMDERDGNRKRMEQRELAEKDALIARAISNEMNDVPAKEVIAVDAEFRDLCSTPRAPSLPNLRSLPARTQKRGRPFLSTGFAAPLGALLSTARASRSVHSGSAVVSPATPFPLRRTSSSASLPLCLEKFSVDDPVLAVDPLLGEGGGHSSRDLEYAVAGSTTCVESEEDSISGELCHFRPIKVAPKTPPGKSTEGHLIVAVLVHSKPRLVVPIQQLRRPYGDGFPTLGRTTAPPAQATRRGAEDLAKSGGQSSVFPLTPTNVSPKSLVNRKGRPSDLMTGTFVEKDGRPNLLFQSLAVSHVANKENPGEVVKQFLPTGRRRKSRDEEKPMLATPSIRPNGVTATTTDRVRLPRSSTVVAVGFSDAVSLNLDASNRWLTRSKLARQLESDHLLALKLDKEMRGPLYSIDRRAGTEGQYHFRQRSQK